MNWKTALLNLKSVDPQRAGLLISEMWIAASYFEDDTLLPLLFSKAYPLDEMANLLDQYGVPHSNNVQLLLENKLG